jgi:hypothetical protein
MQWKKHGKIFDPADHALINSCITHAQSPQAVMHDDLVRIYFSSRALDDNGKFLSHVAYADFEKDLHTIRGVNKQTVLPLGELGAFDEHGVFPISPVRIGNRIFAYTTGWTRRVSVSVDTGVGLAISDDQGLTFQRQGSGPILSATLHEPFLVCDAFVRKFAGQFHMWYVFGTSWRRKSPNSLPDRTYKIGHAVSDDGITWRKKEAHKIVSDQLGEDESQALPTVICIDECYHMFFTYRESFDFRSTKGRGYQIGHAWSDDLENWTRDDESPRLIGTRGEWDSDMQCYPHVFECDNRVYLLYNGNNFGRDGFGLAELVI